MAEIRLDRKLSQPDWGKGVICDFCISHVDERRSEEEGLLSCGNLTMLYKAPLLIRFEGGYEYCSGYEPILLDDMLMAIDNTFGENNVEEHKNDGMLAKEYAIHFGTSLATFYIKRGYKDPWKNNEQMVDNWSRVVMEAQGGRWNELRGGIDGVGKEILNQKEEYPISGFSAPDDKIEGIDTNWKKYGNSLRRLAALLPTE